MIAEYDITVPTNISEVKNYQEVIVSITIDGGINRNLIIRLKAGIEMKQEEILDLLKFVDNNMFDTILKKVAEHIND